MTRESAQPCSPTPSTPSTADVVSFGLGDIAFAGALHDPVAALVASCHRIERSLQRI